MSGALLPYQVFNGDAPSALEASPAQLDRVLREIVAVEGPVVGERVRSVYVTASGGRRVGRTIAKALNRALSRMLRAGDLVEQAPTPRSGNGFENLPASRTA